MKAKHHIISTVSGTFTMLMCAMAVYSMPVFAKGNDPSNGQCDEYRGKTRAICRQAHRTSNRIEKLKENGSELSDLRDAERKLERTKTAFFNLTGLPVPGLTLPCEIPEINALVEYFQNRPDELLPDAIISYPALPADNICRISYEPGPAYAELPGCDTGAQITINSDSHSYRGTGLAIDSEGNVVSCFVFGRLPARADMLQLEACAISLGCDVSEQQ